MKGAITFLIFAIACLNFGASYFNQFALDDSVHLVKNVDIRSLSGSLEAFGLAMFPGNLYRPIATLSYGITYALFGLDPKPYHLANIVLHGLICVLIFKLLARMFEARMAALIALIFAVHPLHTEVVANITNRTELLSNLAGLAAIYLTVSFIDSAHAVGRWKRLMWRYLITGIFLIALLSKESAMVYLVVAPLVVYFLNLRNRRIILQAYGSLLLGALVYLGLRFSVLGPEVGLSATIDPLDNPLVSLSLPLRLLNAFVILGRYLGLALVPYPLSADYSYNYVPIIGNFWELGRDSQALGYLLLVIFVGLVGLVGMRSRRTDSFGVLWFLVTFLVTANLFFPIGTIMGERLAYMPSLGVIILEIDLIRRLVPRLSTLVVFVMTVLFVQQSVRQSAYWFDNQTLHSHQIDISGASARTHANFALVEHLARDYEGALAHFHQALKIYPHFAEAAYGLALVYNAKKLKEGSRHWITRALHINSKFIPARLLLGEIAFEQGDTTLAQAEFEHVLEIDARNFDAGLGMLAVCLRKQDRSCAEYWVSELNRRDPNHPQLIELAKKL